MNALLSCVNVCKEISDRVSEVEKQVISNGIQSKGNVYTGFPSSDGLEEKITLFLTKAKRAIQRIVVMFNIFYNSGITNPRIDKLVEWSTKNGIAPRVIGTLKYFEPVAQYIIDLRNRQEHPKENYTLEVSDFTILANGEISAPLWGMETPKYSIHKEMNVLIKEFVAFIEWLLINIVLSNEKKGPLFEYRVFEIPEEHQDKDCPIKYKVEICFKEKGDAK